jgi:hypothetical protein
VATGRWQLGVVFSIGQATEAGEALAEVVVTQTATTYAFKANLLALKTQDRLPGILFDLRA